MRYRRSGFLGDCTLPFSLGRAAKRREGVDFCANIFYGLVKICDDHLKIGFSFLCFGHVAFEISNILPQRSVLLIKFVNDKFEVWGIR